MNHECTSLKLKSALRTRVTNEGVIFLLGTQSFFGNLFVFITFISYTASILSMGWVLDGILREISRNLQVLGYLLSVVFAIALFFYGLLVFPFFLIVSLFLTVGGYFIYISNNESLLTYSLPLIVVGHIGNHVFQIVKGDELGINFSSNKYNINYRHKVIDEGEFSQNDIEIRVSEAAEAGYCYDAVFLPATKKPMGYDFSLPSILKVQGHGDDKLQEIVHDLGKLFDNLGVSYDKNSWVVVKGKGITRKINSMR